MPPSATSRFLTPTAVVDCFGRRSALAQKLLPALADEQTVLPCLGIPTSGVNADKLAKSAALSRWQKEMDLPAVSPAKLIAATQVYAALVIHWLGQAVVRNWQLQTDSQYSPFASPEIQALDSHPPAELAKLFSACRQTADDFELTTSSLTRDYFKGFYQQLIPREVRHALGEYYTPDWLAEHLLQLAIERMDASGSLGRMIDPACGSGTFLLQGISHYRNCLPSAPLNTILQNVVGVDLHPLAVAAARLNYLLAIFNLLPIGSPLPSLPVYRGDTILLEPELTSRLGRFDLVIGNPPWVGWETLPPEYREQTRSRWVDQGLFAHRGMSTILGSGKKDLSMLLSYVASDQLLAEGGRLAFLTTQAVFKTSAGAGFRQFAVGTDKTPVSVEYVADLSAVQPFPGANSRTVLFVWQKGKPTTYPVPYVVWKPMRKQPVRLPEEAALDQVLSLVQREVCEAVPANLTETTSTWLTLPAADRTKLTNLIGPSIYRAHEGANTGGANGVYWLQTVGTDDRQQALVAVQNIIAGAKRVVPQVTAELERDLLYPLLRGADVRRWRAVPAAWLLLVQDVEARSGISEDRLRRDFPRAYDYLQQFEQMLRDRAAYRRYFVRKQSNEATPRACAPFYSMFDVGRYTLAPCKVVWHRMLAPVQAAVVELFTNRPIIPQETLAFVPCETATEAHYLAGLLNSSLFNQAAAAHSQAGGKSFASPHLLHHLRLPCFEAENPTHQAVAQEAQRLAKQALDLPALVRGRKNPTVAQTLLDELACRVWN